MRVKNFNQTHTNVTYDGEVHLHDVRIEVWAYYITYSKVTKGERHTHTYILMRKWILFLNTRPVTAKWQTSYMNPSL
jgi:hypothetical protein